MKINRLETSSNLFASQTIGVLNRDALPTVFKGPFARNDSVQITHKASPQSQSNQTATLPRNKPEEKTSQSGSPLGRWFNNLKIGVQRFFGIQPAQSQPIQNNPQSTTSAPPASTSVTPPAVSHSVKDIAKPPQPSPTQVSESPTPTPRPQLKPEVLNYTPTAIPTDTQRGPYPRYDKIFEDGLMDVTIAVGYDEPGNYYNGSNIAEERKLDQQLRARGYVKNESIAKEWLAEAGRSADQNYAAFYVRENIAQHNGEAVNSVIRVIKSGRGQNGSQTKAAALQGMNQSDVFMYGGHARYGSGPDFNQNFKITINWDGVANAPARGTIVYEDYKALKKLLSPSNNNAEAIARFKEIQQQGNVSIEGLNDGNIVLNKSKKHQNEFGGYLMYEAVKDSPLELKDALNQDSYRLWLLNGCRTKDYTHSIRSQAKANPNLNTENLDLFVTRESLYWNNISDSLMGFLDGVLAQNHTVGIIHRLREANPKFEVRTHGRQGFDDNPWKNPVKN